MNKTILFADDFNIKSVAEAVYLSNSANLEAYLRDSKNEDVILEGVRVYNRDKDPSSLTYNQFKFLAYEEAHAVKTDHIVLVAGTDKGQLFMRDYLTRGSSVPMKFRFHGLEHGLIGGIKLPGKDIPDNLAQRLAYVTTQLRNKRFVKLFKPRQNPGQPYFSDLFREEARQMSRTELAQLLDVVLINRTEQAVFAKSIPKKRK